MTLEEIAEQIGMTFEDDEDGGAWLDPEDWTAFHGISPDGDCLRNHLLTGDRSLRIAAKVLRVDGRSYEIASTSVPDSAIYIAVIDRTSGRRCDFYSQYPDEPTAILAAAEALPSPITKETKP
jgi:hypothetical protein